MICLEGRIKFSRFEKRVVHLWNLIRGGKTQELNKNLFYLLQNVQQAKTLKQNIQIH
jgi:hypothetical protein